MNKNEQNRVAALRLKLFRQAIPADTGYGHGSRTVPGKAHTSVLVALKCAPPPLLPKRNSKFSELYPGTAWRLATNRPVISQCIAPATPHDFPGPASVSAKPAVRRNVQLVASMAVISRTSAAVDELSGAPRPHSYIPKPHKPMTH